MRDHLILIDASAYIWRAFHAIPMLTRRSDGLPVNALKGFCETMFRFLTDMHTSPTHFAVVFDHPTSRAARQAAFPQYKANRVEVPSEIVPQLKLCRSAARAFGFACIDQPGHEADDIIATYAEEMSSQLGTTVIVSGDKDFMQLISSSVSLFDPFRHQQTNGWGQGKGDLGRWIDRDDVIVKFGVGPEQLCEVMAICGDVADNIPGVYRMGPKTAAKLVKQFGTVERIIESIDLIKNKTHRDLLKAHVRDLRVSRQLVELDRHVKAGQPPMEELSYFVPEVEDIVSFLKGAELYTIARKVCDHFNVNIDYYEPDQKIAQPGAGTGWRPTADAQAV